MADWTYTPLYSHRLANEPPTTLITRYEDGKEHRRQKHSAFPRRFTERHVVTESDASAMTSFYEARGLLTSFTKVSYDPSEAAAAEATVRFVRELRFEQTGPDMFETEIEFIEVL